MKIRRFKLTSMASAVIKTKEMLSIVGGVEVECSCSCYYQDQGGSSTGDNKMANYAYGYKSEKRSGCVTAGYSSEDGNMPVVFTKEN